MAMLKNAIETIYVSQQQQMADLTTTAQRVDTVESVQERDRAMMRAELQRMSNEVPVRINGVIDEKLQPFGEQMLKVQAYLEQLDKDRPAEGVTLVESFKMLDANIAEMKAQINLYSIRTDGKIAAAQGAATSAAHGTATASQGAMPESEVYTLNSMYQELGVLKTWSATAATTSELAHHERCLYFINVQLAGTNERDQREDEQLREQFHG